MGALLRRSVRRAWRREELWNGNRERFRQLLKTEKEQNILLWAWTQFNHYREGYRADKENADWAHLTFVRLRSRKEIADWLSALDDNG